LKLLLLLLLAPSLVEMLAEIKKHEALGKKKARKHKSTREQNPGKKNRVQSFG
jgi:hypothetical protein